MTDSTGQPLKVGDATCPNCGDGCGWHRWRDGWAACADCNDDMAKPKPNVCRTCGETPSFCGCASPGPVSALPDDRNPTRTEDAT